MTKHQLELACGFFMLFFLLFFISPVHAAIYQLPQNGDNIIGKAQIAKVQPKDNLHRIARRYDVGYDALILANPLIAPDKISINQTIHIPSIYIVPQPINIPSITINLAEKRLYYHINKATVFTAPIAIGRKGWETPVTTAFVTRKVEEPYWRVPEVIRTYNRKQGKTTPKLIPPGANNPLGMHAIALSLPDYILHGTNDPTTIGKNISAGCIRMYPEDIKALFAMIPIGTPVNIINQPYKVGRLNHHTYIEVHASKNAEKILHEILQQNPNLIVKNINILNVIQQGRGIPQKIS